MADLAVGSQLPPELIAKILDSVGISELIWLSHVCSAWRRAAHAHPIFWRDIRLRGLNRVAVDCFLARLRAHTSAINLEIRCFSYGPRNIQEEILRQLRSVVLPACQSNLHRTLRLHVESNVILPEICTALTQPAPLLQTLDIFSTSRDGTLAVLPENFLGGCGPKLTKVCLLDIALPRATRVVTAFRNVESLRFHYERCELAVHDVLAHFPALQNLQIYLHRCLPAGARISSPCRPPASLDVRVRNGNYAPFFAAFRPAELATITRFTCPAYGARGWMRAPLGGLDGPLTLALRDRVGSGAIIELSSCPGDSSPERTSTRTRRFLVDDLGEETAPWSQVREELFPPDLLARVSRVRVALSQRTRAGIVVEMGVGALVACETLELYLDWLSWNDHPLVVREPYGLLLPAVRTVVCAATENSPVAVAIAVDDLSALLGSLIPARPSPLDVIKLVNVHLTGDVTALEREYGCRVLL